MSKANITNLENPFLLEGLSSYFQAKNSYKGEKIELKCNK